jgi:hypothetical protein
MLHKVKNFVLYVAHEGNINGTDWENPTGSVNVQDGPGPSGSAPVYFTEEDSEEGSDLVDSDNDIKGDDDNLFMDNVDEEVTDEEVSIGNRGKARMSKEGVAADNGSDMSSDDELQLPDSDKEGQDMPRFRSFISKDVHNPIFKVGLLFESVDLLRKAVTEYSVRERVEVKIPRNERKRYHAICEEGCLWELYASKDPRANGMVIKRYNGTHSC